MNRPRVLHVYKDYFPPVLGGIEKTINLLGQGTRDEFDISVLVCKGPEPAGESIVDGVHVIRVPEWGRFSSAPISPAFVTALRKHGAAADLLHLHHPNPTGDVAFLLTRPKAPAVMTYHSDIVRQKYSMLLFAPFQKRVMASCRYIMPTSPNYIESSPWLGQFRDKCSVVPLGIKLEDFDATPEVQGLIPGIRSRFPGPCVIFVGRLRYYKGLQFLLPAMRNLEATLLIVGTGPMEPSLKEQVTHLGLAERVHFLGNLPHSQLVAHLRASDCFVMPSHLRSEAFGLSQVEAMACGLPVVSTNIPTGVPFVNQDSVTGFTVAPESPQAMSDALGKLLGNGELRATMGTAARQRAETLFSASAMCAGVKAIYRQALKDR
ncbi:MAG: glycosyltransferase [Candidatus Sumerlaeaceae bacterium]|nr:glycosyltransferase [Candidatus Sumerlaeaceae bacterium]